MASDIRILSESDIKNEIKAGVHGGYFFFGDEDYLKSFYAAELVKSVIDPSDPFGSFNHIILNTDRFDGGELESALASMPMMGELKLVEMRSPDMISWKEKEKNEFADIISRLNEYQQSVLLVTVNKDCFDEGILPKRPSAMFKTIAKYMTPVQFSLQSEAKLSRWIQRKIEQSGCRISPEAATFMLSYCGRDMRSLSQETDKVAAYVLANEKNEVTAKEIEYVCSASREEDAFELANAVISGDRSRALAALLLHKQRREDPIAVLAAVSHTMIELFEASVIVDGGGDKKEIASALKIHEFRAEMYKKAVSGVEPERLRAALERCRKTDALLKSTTLGYIALERLVATIPQLSKIRNK